MITVVVRETVDLTAAERRALAGLLPSDLGEPGAQHFMLWQEDQLLAHAAVARSCVEHGGARVAAALVSGVIVAPRQRAMGLGKSLLQLVMTTLRSQPAVVALTICPAPAATFFERLGWLRLSTPVADVQGHALSGVALLLPLALQPADLLDWQRRPLRLHAA